MITNEPKVPVMKNNIAIIYGPQGGNTERVAKLLADKIGLENCTLIPVKETTPETFSKFNSFIFGGSTIGTHNWSIPSTSDDWDIFLPKFRKIDMSGKKVAIFGLGDHIAYPNNFVDGMRVIYDALTEKNTQIFGQCNTDEYEFNESEAVVNGMFVGLPVDEDFEEEFTEQRIENWLNNMLHLL